MKEYIIKVDDLSERAWDGSRKVFETKELVRCKDCKHGTSLNGKIGCVAINGLHDANWFCADGERSD